jgi:hypothetical protein
MAEWRFEGDVHKLEREKDARPKRAQRIFPRCSGVNRKRLKSLCFVKKDKRNGRKKRNQR